MTLILVNLYYQRMFSKKIAVSVYSTQGGSRTHSCLVLSQVRLPFRHSSKWLQGRESNSHNLGYEPSNLPLVIPCDIGLPGETRTLTT